MKCIWILLAVLSCSIAGKAQAMLPPGTIIPVRLDHTLDAKKVHDGQRISAEVMQSLPGTPVRRRAHVVGQVIAVEWHEHSAASLTLTFNAVVVHGVRIPFQADLRALASLVEVEEAQIPEEGASRGITPEVATTQQIGGEQVYRGGGPVAAGSLTVGEPAPYGVLALPRRQAGTPCRGVIDSNRQPQAFWLFSTNACGVYGYGNLRIEHAGRTKPEGQFHVVANDGKLILYSGSGLLLRVNGTKANQ